MARRSHANRGARRALPLELGDTVQAPSTPRLRVRLPCNLSVRPWAPCESAEPARPAKGTRSDGAGELGNHEPVEDEERDALYDHPEPCPDTTQSAAESPRRDGERRADGDVAHVETDVQPE